MVKVYLIGRCWERSATKVVDHRARLNSYAPTAQLHTPLEVNLLHMGEEILIEASHSNKDLATTTHRSTTCPKYIAPIIILTAILLHRREYSTTTEGVAKVVDKATRSTRILKAFRLSHRAQLWRYNSNIGTIVEHLNQRFQPPLGDLDIGVKQNDIVCIYSVQSTVVATCKAVILIQQNRSKLWIVHSEPHQRVVRRAIIGHYDLGIGRVPYNASKVAFQELAPIPVEYDDRRFHQFTPPLQPPPLARCEGDTPYPQ